MRPSLEELTATASRPDHPLVVAGKHRAACTVFALYGPLRRSGCTCDLNGGKPLPFNRVVNLPTLWDQDDSR
jgi:hypothetical protein